MLRLIIRIFLGFATGLLTFGAERAATAADASAVPRTGPVKLAWLGDNAPLAPLGVSWGVPWPRGALLKGTPLTARGADGRTIATQNWPLAFWPDGSVKWSGLSIAANTQLVAPMSVEVGSTMEPESPLRVQEDANVIDISTGRMRCRIARSGFNFIESLTIDGGEVGRNGHLIAIREDRSRYASEKLIHEEDYIGRITKVTVEQAGPVRAVVRVEGAHAGGIPARTWLPFSVRLYFTAGLSSIRIVHSFVVDGDANTDFVRGLGLGFTVPFREEKQNRHIRFAGDAGGLWSEPVLLSPHYRDGMVKDALQMSRDQLAGKRIPNLGDLASLTKTQIETGVAVWDAFKLTQLSADSFAIDKRTGPAGSWLRADVGHRARGFVFLGDVSGGLAVGVKRFWEKHPAALEITGASTAAADLKIWFWSPDAPAMDLRRYDNVGHDDESLTRILSPVSARPKA